MTTSNPQTAAGQALLRAAQHEADRLSDDERQTLMDSIAVVERLASPDDGERPDDSELDELAGYFDDEPQAEENLAGYFD